VRHEPLLRTGAHAVDSVKAGIFAVDLLKSFSQRASSALDASFQDSSGRERSVLTPARPALKHAVPSAGRLTLLEQQLALCEHALESFAPPLLHVDTKGKILWGSPPALRLLRAYCEWAGTSAQLPALLRRMLRWRSHGRAGLPIEVRKEQVILGREGASLLVRLVEGNGRLWLLLDERCRPLNGTRVQAHGLTEREAEVLQWLAAGKSNIDIGKILSISPRTVEKHLERIFQRLGVETRTAAAAEFYLLTQQATG
jgi:DNA-binding CsgD family transcriptional regulator